MRGPVPAQPLEVEPIVVDPGAEGRVVSVDVGMQAGGVAFGKKAPVATSAPPTALPDRERPRTYVDS